MEPQPAEEVEQANAAYVWRKEVQRQLLSAMQDPSVKLETAQWWFDRFSRAYEKEREANQRVKEQQKRNG